MKSVVALFLSLVMFVGGLMPHNDVEELSKLPYLIQHFQYHRTVQGGCLSVGQFLRMHYGPSAEQHIAAAPEHDRLPFLGTHHFPNLEYVVPISPMVTPTTSPEWLTREYRLSVTSPYCFAFSDQLLQPPRA